MITKDWTYDEIDHAKRYKRYFIVMIQHASFEGKAIKEKQSFKIDFPVLGVQMVLGSSLVKAKTILQHQVTFIPSKTAVFYYLEQPVFSI